MPKQPDQHDRAADLLERLLTDPKFRAAFRRNPAAAAKKYELDDLAEEFSAKGKAMYTLEIRESRSSLAGVMMAAAAEGVDASDLSQSAGAGQLDTPASIAVNRALSRANLQAVTGGAATGGGGGNGVAAAVDQTASAADGTPAVPAADAAGIEVAPPPPAVPAVDPTASAGAAPAGVELGAADIAAAPAPAGGAAGIQEAHRDFGVHAVVLPRLSGHGFDSSFSAATGQSQPGSNAPGNRPITEAAR